MKNAFRHSVRATSFLVGVVLGVVFGWSVRAFGPYMICRNGSPTIAERCQEIHAGMTVDRALEVVRSGSVPTDEGVVEGRMFFSSPAGTCEVDYAEETKEAKQVRFVKSLMK